MIQSVANAKAVDVQLNAKTDAEQVDNKATIVPVKSETEGPTAKSETVEKVEVVAVKSEVAALTAKSDTVDKVVAVAVNSEDAGLTAKSDATEQLNKATVKSEDAALTGKSETSDNVEAIAVKSENAALTAKSDATEQVNKAAVKSEDEVLTAKSDATEQFDKVAAVQVKSETAELSAKSDTEQVGKTAEVPAKLEAEVLTAKSEVEKVDQAAAGPEQTNKAVKLEAEVLTAKTDVEKTANVAVQSEGVIAKSDTKKEEEKVAAVVAVEVPAKSEQEQVLTAKQENVTPGCPNPKSIAPCVCNNIGSPKGTVVVDCTGTNSTDAHTETVLNLFLTTPGLGPVGAVALVGLTSIPTQISKFDKLSMVSLLDNNIQTIPTGAFNFSSSQNSQFMISLKGNQLTSVQPGAFDGKYGKGSAISLVSNQLARFEAESFENILQQLTPFAPESRLIVSNSKYYQIFVSVLKITITLNSNFPYKQIHSIAIQNLVIWHGLSGIIAICSLLLPVLSA